MSQNLHSSLTSIVDMHMHMHVHVHVHVHMHSPCNR